jgi:MFS family permease
VVRGLGAVSFFNDLASEMVYPLLPLLLTRGLGAGALALGALDGVADAVSAVVKLGAGRLADRPGWRRPLIVGGYLLAAGTRPMIGVAAAAWQVVGLRAADRVGKGARNPPRDAVIADAVSPALRGRAFGFHRAMDHAGATIGPLAAGAMMAVWSLSADTVILWSAVPGVLAAALAARTLRGASAATEPAAAALPAGPPPGAVGPAGTVALVFAFAAVRLPETLLLLRLQDLGVAAPLIPVWWAGLHVVRTAASYPGGWLTDRLGASRTLALGWLLHAAVVLGLAAAAGPWQAGAAFLGLGLATACTEPPERALVAAWGGRVARGRRFGWYHAGTGLLALPGGLTLGAVYQAYGGVAALATSGVLVLLLGAVGVAVARRPA